MKIELYEVILQYGDTYKKEYVSTLPIAQYRAGIILNNISMTLNPTITIRKCILEDSNCNLLKAAERIVTHVANAETNWQLRQVYTQVTLCSYFVAPDEYDVIKPIMSIRKDFDSILQAVHYAFDWFMSCPKEDITFVELWDSDYLNGKFNYIGGFDKCSLDELKRMVG